MKSNGCVSIRLGLKIKDMDEEIRNFNVVEYQHMHYWNTKYINYRFCFSIEEYLFVDMNYTRLKLWIIGMPINMMNM